VDKSGFTVRTDIFEGPLDLLLELVNKRRLFISDVSLATVTDDFIQYIKDRDDFPIGESAEFIAVASTLMLIKSRSLLPGLELTEDEEESIHDLEERLALYQNVKEIAQKLRQIYGKRIVFEKLPTKNLPIIFSPDRLADAKSFGRALLSVLESLPKKELIPDAVVKKIITLEEMIERLSLRIEKSIKMSFHEFVGGKNGVTREERISVIVGFLAMLELVRRGAIEVTQNARGEIEMETEMVKVPIYG
jgi:segregation and condensation protein A